MYDVLLNTVIPVHLVIVSTPVKDATLSPPPPVLPHDARHPRPIKSAEVLKKRHVVGLVGTRRATLRSGVQNGVHQA